MRVGGQHFRTIWLADDGWRVCIIDQRYLPHQWVVAQLEQVQHAVDAIRDMQVRGAPLIGATAAYGLCLALHHDASDNSLRNACAQLKAARPTAVNLAWAVDRLSAQLSTFPADDRCERAYALAAGLCDDDVRTNRALGEQGLSLIARHAARLPEGRAINILTHCNAGWLATVDWGTALAPIFLAHRAGIKMHVWVDETRPRNQGALTAWELEQQSIAHTYIVDNAGGHLMQRGLVDLCITGTDRVTRNGDVCNKIGTYLKALAARDNSIPFYVALPSSTIDWQLGNGLDDVPIETRGDEEVTRVRGLDHDGKLSDICVTGRAVPVRNDAFDVTPARLITAFITERGVCAASEAGLRSLFPETVAVPA